MLVCLDGKVSIVVVVVAAAVKIEQIFENNCYNNLKDAKVVKHCQLFSSYMDIQPWWFNMILLFH
jgi:hypothetical protein